MKKLFVMLTMALMVISANAFEFDGIDLNSSYENVARQISIKNYSYDAERNCLKGMCQGTEIYVGINYVDVKEAGKVGQLIVEIPMQNANHSQSDIITVFNVLYHQIAKNEKAVTYQVDPDGTQLVVSQKANAMVLTYNTPYYKVRK